VTVRAVPLDFADSKAPQILAKTLAEESIEVEMLVNNAGVSALGPLAESDPTSLRAVIDVKRWRADRDHRAPGARHGRPRPRVGHQHRHHRGAYWMRD